MRSIPNRPARNSKILYIEDDPPSRILVRCLLEAQGYRIVDSEEGLAGIEAALREQPQLILLDLQLPDVDGQTVASILRTFPKLTGTPIVGITAHEGEGERERTLVAGCDGYITKPIDPDRFPGQIAEFLAGKREVISGGEPIYLRELNQRLICRLLVQLDTLRRLNEQTTRRASRLEAIHDAMYDLSSALGLTPLLDRLLPSLADALGAVEVTVELSHPPETHLTGRATTVEPGTADLTSIEWKFPLIVRYRPLGFIVARFANGDGAAVEDEHLFKIVANHVAIAVENARLLEVERAARLQTEAEQRRSAYLARVSEVLASSVDYERTVSQIAGLVIPELADACIVDLLERDSERLRRSVVAIGDPGRADLAAALREHAPTSIRAEHPVSRALRAGESVLTTLDVAESGLASMIIPIKTRERTLGALTLMSLDPARRYGPVDLALAEEVAWRAALVLDSGLLYHEAREADRHKSQFLVALAHELRTPLAPIVSAAEVIQQHETAAPEVHRLSQIIEQQARYQARILDDLLDLARVEYRRIELRRTPVDLRAVVTASLVTTRPAIEGRDHRLTVSLPDHPVIVLGDRTRLQQVAANLLSNAARYTPPGGRITATLEHEGDVAVLRVRDTGRGIPADMVRRIFEMFTRVERTESTAEKAGLGIGLALVRRLVALHGGTVEATSEGPNRGSEFIVRLPISGASAVTEPAPPAMVVAPRRLLLIEDSTETAEALRMALQKTGHRVDVAHSGPQGVQIALTSRPDAVVIHLGLPGMTGHEVARRIRAVMGDEVTLVALTAHSQEDDRRRTQEAGFDAHVLKPAGADEINEVLTRRPPRAT
jgi:signal transduction histidine kinase/DNA-binding response OmpR family regulator